MNASFRFMLKATSDYTAYFADSDMYVDLESSLGPRSSPRSSGPVDSGLTLKSLACRIAFTLSSLFHWPDILQVLVPTPTPSLVHDADEDRPTARSREPTLPSCPICLGVSLTRDACHIYELRLISTLYDRCLLPQE